MKAAGILFIIFTCLIAVMFLVVPSAQADAPCGDANNDGVLNISDAIYLIDYLYIGGSAPAGDGDVDECGGVNISDVTYIADYVFMGGPMPCEGSVTCYHPNDNSSIVLDCPGEVNAGEVDEIEIPVYINCDESLVGLAIGFTTNSDVVTITSVNTDGSVLPDHFLTFTYQDDPAEGIQFMAITLANMGNPLPPQNNGLLFNLVVDIPPNTPDLTIDIDTVTLSTVYPPDGENIFSVYGGGSIRPQYTDCGEADLTVTGREYICGDANNDGTWNIADVVYIIRYVFVGGVPPVPYEAGDANCDGVVGISDAVYIINYIFTGGSAPCDTNGDGIPDC